MIYPLSCSSNKAALRFILSFLSSCRFSLAWCFSSQESFGSFPFCLSLCLDLSFSFLRAEEEEDSESEEEDEPAEEEDAREEGEGERKPGSESDSATSGGLFG
jgi:hypothetical protein